MGHALLVRGHEDIKQVGRITPCRSFGSLALELCTFAVMPEAIINPSVALHILSDCQNKWRLERQDTEVCRRPDATAFPAAWQSSTWMSS